MKKSFSTLNNLNRRSLLKTTAAGAAFAASTSFAASKTFAAPALLKQGSEVTIEVWGGVPPEKGPGDLVEAFMEANPSIKVNYTRYVNDDTGNIQLDTALQGGSNIDVFATYGIPRLGQRISAGATKDLTSYIEADADIKAWVDETEGLYVVDGQYHCLPTFIAPNFVFLNQGLLEAAGIEVPTEWTVDDFVAMAEELSGDMTFGAFSAPPVDRMKLGSNYYFNAEGTASNFADPAFRETVELHKSMIDNGTSLPWDEVLSQDLRVYAQTPFLTELDAIWVSSDYSLRFIADKEQYPHEFITTFAPMPWPADVEEPYNPGTIGGWLAVTESSEKADASWEFIKFWLTQGGPHMLKAGNNPSFPGTDMDAVVEGILGPDREELFDVEAYKRVALEPTHRLVTDTITTGAAEIQQIKQGLDDRFLLGEISIDEWQTELTTKADEAIANAAN